MSKKTDFKIKLGDEYLPKTKTFISQVLSYLEDTQAIEEIDSAGLESLAYYYDSFTRISEVIKKDGVVKRDKGLWKVHHLQKQCDEVQIQLFKILQEYGLSLRSRSKIKIEVSDAANPLEEWIEKLN